jgi:hypothetical protein
MRILGVNGIHNWSWSKSSFTDKFLDALSNEHEVIDVKYPRMFAILAYSQWAIDRRAKKILEANKSADDVLIAHSFGCLASIRAMELGARFKTVFFFAPAAECDVILKHHYFEKCYVIHSKDDLALGAGNVLPLHKFGELGKYGYTGSNENVINVNADGLGHGDYVEPKHLCEWVKFIKSKI